MTTYNHSLLCNTFAGIKRLNSSFTNSTISASDMQNVELFNTGINSGIGIRTMKGNQSVLRLENTLEKIINIFSSIQNTETYIFIHTETNTEGRIYLFNPISSSVTLKVQGLNITGKSCGVDFAQGWSDLFLFTNGKNILSIQIGNYGENGENNEVKEFTPKDVDGRTISGLGLVVFDGRIWIFNDSTLWYSVKENCYDFSTEDSDIVTSAGYIEFAKKITAIYPYLSSLAVFHKDSSCLVKINTDSTYSKSDDSPGGCSSFGSIVFHGTELYFYDDTKKGIFSFSQIITGNKTLSQNISLDVQEELINIKQTQINDIKMLSVVLSDRNEIWLLLPSNNEHSTILIYDYIHQQWVKRKSQNIVNFTVVNNVLYSVGNNKIYQEYIGENFDGEFIQAYYNCSPLNLSADNTLKILYIPPRITLNMDSPNDFYVKYIKNYDYIKTPKIKHIFSKYSKNLFYWDLSYWDSNVTFKTKETNSIKKIPPSTFKTLEIQFFTTKLSQGFSIKNIEFSKIKVKQL